MLKNFNLYGLLCSGFVLFILSCKDQPEQIPAYLLIDSFAIDEPGGNSRHEIVDGWLYVNGELLGAYTLPATIPVLAEGNTEVIVFPGIKENGQIVTPGIFPFFDEYKTQATLVPAETATIKPSTKYKEETNVPWSDAYGSFDGGSHLKFENRDTDFDLDFSITTDGAFAGKCLLMKVDTAHILQEIASEALFDLPITGGRQIWLEIHQKADMPFSLGITYKNIGEEEGIYPYYTFAPKNEWNKTYINLTEPISELGKKEYRLFFRANLPIDKETGKFLQNKGEIRIDNLKILYF